MFVPNSLRFFSAHASCSVKCLISWQSSLSWVLKSLSSSQYTFLTKIFLSCCISWICSAMLRQFQLLSNYSFSKWFLIASYHTHSRKIFAGHTRLHGWGYVYLEAIGLGYAKRRGDQYFRRFAPHHSIVVGKLCSGRCHRNQRVEKWVLEAWGGGWWAISLKT